MLTAKNPTELRSLPCNPVDGQLRWRRDRPPTPTLQPLISELRTYCLNPTRDRVSSRDPVPASGNYKTSRFPLIMLMPRCKRNLAPGCYYHLYNRGNNHQPIFFERENYLYFLKQFRYYLAEQTVHAIAYCLMPNHYHFLIYLRNDSLSAAMHKFSLSYTNAINRRYGRCGSLFQGRFQTIHVDGDDYLLNLTRYIHLNPVKAGLVKRPEEWEFSSYRDYVNLRQGTLPKLDEGLKHVGTAQAYRIFVETRDGELQQSIQHLMLNE